MTDSQRPLRISCVGGGPAGLLFAILAARAGHQVEVLERLAPDATFGWGVVFSDDLLDQLEGHDPELAGRLREHAYTWHDQTIVVGEDEPARLPGAGFSMRRRLLLELLRTRAVEVGAQLVARQVPADLAGVDADLVIASDGVNSAVRGARPEFGTRLTRRHNKYIWLGTDQEFTSFTFPFVRTPAGWVWGHAYGFAPGASTFIVETGPETWAALGFDRLGPDATMRRLEEIFGGVLEGHRLQPQPGTRDRTPWADFAVVQNQRWHVGGAGEQQVVLMGDAAHTTHFTIGSGTLLAMEDAMALSDTLAAEPTTGAALAAYEARRRRELQDVQREAARSARWFEQVPRYATRAPQEVARLMARRHSAAVAHLPVAMYLGLVRAAHHLPVVKEPLRRLAGRF